MVMTVRSTRMVMGTVVQTGTSSYDDDGDDGADRVEQ